MNKDRTSTTGTIPQRPALAPDFTARPADQIIGFRIMRETEIAPSWWAQAKEIGETASATVADKFCTEQNSVTMDPNRVKRHRYYADPIYADGPALAPDSAQSSARDISAAKARYQELVESSAPLRNRVIGVHDWASKRALWAADDEMAVLREQIARAGSDRVLKAVA
ncbi:hypothetical protein [Streptomyces sp. NPDC060366]|uniref:hypothetical protein n=1 Tax=Streptomyces sp. NPDC060366 TaxID=3347105 RepID=UPI00364FABD5